MKNNLQTGRFDSNFSHILKSNIKFEKRFNYIEKELGKDNKKLSEMDLDELNTLWDDSKKLR